MLNSDEHAPAAQTLRPLDSERIQDAVRTRVPGLLVRHVGETGSTNRDLARLASSGAPDWTVLVADSQSEGRGRHTRSWASPPGGLYVSILMRINADEAAGAVTLLPLAAGLAVHEALTAIAEKRGKSLPVTLKWPNDLLTPNGKLGGILCETSRINGIWQLITGIGINLTPLPNALRTSLDQAATSLADELDGDRIEREELLIGILNRLEERVHQWSTEPASLRADWTRRSAMMGHEVTVELGDGSLHGIASGIASDGALQLDIDGTLHEVRAAEGIHVRS